MHSHTSATIVRARDYFRPQQNHEITNLHEGSNTIPNHVDGFRNQQESCMESWNHKEIIISIFSKIPQNIAYESHDQF